MQVQKFTFNPFQENTYVLYDETKECVIIDPGCYDKNEQEALKLFIEENGLKPVKLLNTHCHIDHVLGNFFVANTYELDLYMHKDDVVTLNNIPSYAHVYGFGSYQLSPEPSHFLEDGDKVKFGNSELDVIFTPGHAPGHIVFYSAKDSFVINGDVLFQGSFGRVDLPGGAFQTLKDSILNKMFTLPEDTIVYTGHGGETTIGIEKSSNPISYANL
ncbi:MAG: MBL fold metallo-hydrolase [Crocinitomicaceae bacterium]|nr:MBL fold metallo-hydrolase [Crocinitomicaceae bacterium]